MIKAKSPQILLLDIETSPITGYTWTTYDANVLKILEPSKIISVAWKELHSDEVTCKAIVDYKGYKKGVVNDEALIKEVWNVLDRADIVVAHHGDAFDFKRLNARFVYYGLSAPSSYKTVDTKKVASKYFKFDSNSLNNLGAYLNLGKKLSNGGFDLWVNCIEEGDPRAWELMKKYNVQDVNLLEKVYLALRPFMENHPNLNAFSDNDSVGAGPTCPTCKSEHVTKRGFGITRTGRKQRFQCTDCGSWSSGPFQRLKNPILSSEED